MSYEDLDGKRPVKKRRFFDDEPENVPPSAETSTIIRGELPERSEPHSAAGSTSNEKADAFDLDLLSTIIGEALPEWIVEKLKIESGNDIQKGAFAWMGSFRVRLSYKM